MKKKDKLKNKLEYLYLKNVLIKKKIKEVEIVNILYEYIFVFYKVLYYIISYLTYT